jgi:hypothetical protein
MGQIYVQYQQPGSGTWTSIFTLDDRSPSIVILQQMQSVQRMHPGLRVRTADANGRLIDML